MEAKRGEGVAELADRLVLRVRAAATHRRLRNTKQWQQASVGVEAEDQQQQNQRPCDDKTHTPHMLLQIFNYDTL